jgi:hypothetical protein
MELIEKDISFCNLFLIYLFYIKKKKIKYFSISYNLNGIQLNDLTRYIITIK